MLLAQLGASLACLLLGRLDEPLGVRRIRELIAAAARPAAPPAGLEPLAHTTRVEPEPLQHGSGRAVGPEQREHDVLRADRVVLQAHRGGAGLVERALRAGAERVWIALRCGTFLAQSGFASSISMIGIPSSTG